MEHLTTAQARVAELEGQFGELRVLAAAWLDSESYGAADMESLTRAAQRALGLPANPPPALASEPAQGETERKLLADNEWLKGQVVSVRELGEARCGQLEADLATERQIVEDYIGKVKRLEAERETLVSSGGMLHDQLMLWHGSDEWTADDESAASGWLDALRTEQAAGPDCRDCGGKLPHHAVGCRHLIAQTQAAERAAEPAQGESLGQRCAACGAEWLPGSTIDKMSDLVEPYRIRARDAEARLRALEAEREALLDDAEWLLGTIDETGPILQGPDRAEVKAIGGRLDALRSTQAEAKTGETAQVRCDYVDYVEKWPCALRVAHGGPHREHAIPQQGEMSMPPEPCHKCGKPANINDGDDGLGPPVCCDCYDGEWTPAQGGAPAEAESLLDVAASLLARLGPDEPGSAEMHMRATGAVIAYLRTATPAKPDLPGGDDYTPTPRELLARARQSESMARKRYKQIKKLRRQVAVLLDMVREGEELADHLKAQLAAKLEARGER
jgi:hypothetical protein